MGTVAKLLTAVLVASTLCAGMPKAQQSKNDASCGLIEQALRDYEQVKTAGTRREVARYFVPDGGMAGGSALTPGSSPCLSLLLTTHYSLLTTLQLAPNKRLIICT